MSETANWKMRLRHVSRWALRIGGAILLVIVLGMLFWAREALHHRWVRFPKESAAWTAIRADRQEVSALAGWHEYKGLLHSHSHFSHDSTVSFEHILATLKLTGRDFICLSDHCVDGRADFNWQWRGLHEGKLFIPGFEMKDGIMPFGVAAGVILSNRTEGALLAKQVREHGGVLFYAHPEEPRAWDQPEVQGMEIYNLHADFKNYRRGLLMLLPDIWLNLGRFPDHVVRLIFQRPVANLKRWDDCNRARHFTGIAGNDCHENVGLRGSITESGNLRIDDTSPKTLREIKLSGLKQALARLCFGPLTPGRELFHLQLDPYERMVRFVTTHILARELSEAAILESLAQGRTFVGFDMIADSTGFQWCANRGAERAVMGESMAYGPDVRLHAAAPHVCRFTVVKDGQVLCQQEGRSLDHPPPSPGIYRVEAELQILGEWIPWIYANPVTLK